MQILQRVKKNQSEEQRGTFNVKRSWLKIGIPVMLIFVMLGGLSTQVEANATDRAVGTDRIQVYLDRFTLAFDVEPRIIPTSEGGHTVVPFRKLAESLGVQVTWNQANQTIKAVGFDREVVLTINRQAAQVDGQPYALGVAPFVDKGHTLIPLRFFSEVFGADVNWNQQQKVIRITSPKTNMYTFAFYGLGSFSQRQYIPNFDGIGYTWSRINQQGEWTISAANGNEYNWPQDHPDATTQDLIVSGQQGGGEAFLMVAAFESRGEVSAVLLDQGKRNTALQQMLDKVQEENMDGILIDFEGIRSTEEHQALKKAFTRFIQDLTQQAKQHGLKIGVALPPPNNHFNGYEYELIGEAADFIFLMAYDYNPRGAGINHQLPEPMLLVNQGIEQTLETIPASKIVLGINAIYETPETTVDKIGLAKRHGLKGMGLWILRGVNVDYMNQMGKSIYLEK
ncbi:stalk domain-containing protein [Bacillus horti]|uniref:GH18 domain-containing protein n=1 Tax=Caldalkalibacillus horti TaxID=77523 RepID=A0ABT9VYF9_9BACI|nr:stalk domain-containing protein [Bacillus horti]MDQ0166027.1 hypothetical protein [Bacillus horti]